jgi:bacteriorhodopsin
MSFTFTYILLITTGTVTFIEALSTDVPAIRHVMNLETCISIVAGYFYGVFLEQLKSNRTVDITKTRYTDWCITTPMMLLTLCVVLGMNSSIPLKKHIYAIILILNYLMLFIGYLGEINILSRWTATTLGFIPFFLMFGLIYYTFVKPKYVKANYILYGFYLVVWSMYGVVYLFDSFYKNIFLNILDCIAKCLIGLGLWAYYTKIII